MENKGFTLAEVLITLAIIGVVAAMTVPTLMTSTRGKEYEVGAQKAMSTLANAFQMRYAVDGVSLTDYPSGNTAQGARDYLTKPPGWNSNASLDRSRPGEQPVLPIVACHEDDTYAWCKLKDGSLVQFNYMAIWKSDGYSRGGIVITVDTNGEKGPTRTSINTRTLGTKCGNDSISNADGFFTTDDSDKNIKTNNCPDVVAFIFERAGSQTSETLLPANQRTKNILATGNAMISK